MKVFGIFGYYIAQADESCFHGTQCKN